MKSANKKFVQKAIAVILVVTLLYGAGVAPVVMLFVTGVVLIVFLVMRSSQQREVERIFDFYVAADAILRDEDRRWFGFEVGEVIENGEALLESIPDPPPLHLFAIGALYHRVGNYDQSIEYLSRLIEDEHFEELNLTVPSPQLRRYVSVLRRIELEPSLAPQTLGAVRSLERMRRKQAYALLSQARTAVKEVPKTVQSAPKAAYLPVTNNDPVTARQPIGEVLQDIYQDDSHSN